MCPILMLNWATLVRENKRSKSRRANQNKRNTNKGVSQSGQGGRGGQSGGGGQGGQGGQDHPDEPFEEHRPKEIGAVVWEFVKHSLWATFGFLIIILISAGIEWFLRVLEAHGIIEKGSDLAKEIQSAAAILAKLDIYVFVIIVVLLTSSLLIRTVLSLVDGKKIVSIVTKVFLYVVAILSAKNPD
jgi:hypothetical protein